MRGSIVIFIKGIEIKKSGLKNGKIVRGSIVIFIKGMEIKKSR